MRLKVPTTLDSVKPKTDLQFFASADARPGEQDPNAEAIAEKQIIASADFKPTVPVKSATPQQAATSKIATGAPPDAGDAALLESMSSAARLALLNERAKAKLEKKPDVKAKMLQEPPKTPSTEGESKAPTPDSSRGVGTSKTPEDDAGPQKGKSDKLPSAFDFSKPRSLRPYKEPATKKNDAETPADVAAAKKE
jgi:hypothetical protein